VPERTKTRLIQAPRRVRAFLAAREAANNSLILLASDEDAAERYAREAGGFTGGRVVHLPSRGVEYGEVFDPPVERVGRRQRALHSLEGASLVVAGPAAYAERTPLYEPVELSGGVELDPESVISRLSELGYGRVDRVTKPGEFAVRGGILDVFPSTRRSPVRAEWWGDEIESVRAVSLATQRVVRELESVTIYAAREGDLAALAAASDEELPDETGLGIRTPGSDQLLLGLDLVSTAEVAAERLDGAALWREEPDESPASEDVVEAMYDGWADGSYPAADLEFTSRADEAEAVTAPPVTAWAETIREAGRRLDSLVEEGYAAFIACGSAGEARRTAYVFGEANRLVKQAERVDESLPPAVYAVPGEVEEGFSYPEARVAVFRRDALYGRRKAAPRRESAAPGRQVASFADLASGDLVVHATQGIGRFEGLVAKEVLGATRDYMQVSYRDGDTLFVPYEQMELLHKYIGGEAGRLDKLGGESWARVTDRVRSRVRAMAGDLLQLYAARDNAKGHAFPEETDWDRELEESFPYTETSDQEAAIVATKADMQREQPMDRLVCGDVGFGKTEVAVRAAFKAALDGKQTMMIAPTTILVQQHYRTFANRLDKFATRVESISRFSTTAERKKALRDFANGEIDVLVGTHSLLSSEVVPKDLGLVIVDEEQRFGVKHKERLKELKSDVDVLTLTATPIPRTMQMGLSELRDISTIETAPAGRRSILTHVGAYEEQLVEKAIRREIGRGGQIFFVHNRVETIDDTTERLRALVPEASFVTAHGQMPERKLENVMQTFLDAEAQVLVTTTIVESGLDVSTANTLIVDRADKMGLSQLYQLRGRIGRSREQAYAYLFAPLDTTPDSRKRLEALMDFTELGSGFAVAMRDLEIRGAGSLLGAEQSGQIEAVGFEMYLQLLREAVALARGEKIEQREQKPVLVEAPLDAYLPPEYVQDEIERVDLYRRASGLHTLAEAEDLAEELADRFGPLPDPSRNLLALSRVKILARTIGAPSVSYRQGALNIVGVQGSPAAAPAALRRAVGGQVTVKEGRISVRVAEPEEGPLALAESALGALVDAKGSVL
jgi:transcription-repair coupling factor (superfamily II helicase)